MRLSTCMMRQCIISALRTKCPQSVGSPERTYVKYDSVQQPDPSVQPIKMSNWACLALLPFFLGFFPLLLIYEPGYEIGFLLLLLDGAFAVIVMLGLVTQALRARQRERTNLLLLLIFPGFIVACMLFYAVSVARFGLAVLRP